MPAGLPRLEMTFLIDANGILNVTATELRSGTRASVEVRPTYGLTEAEVERMIEVSFEFAEQDVHARMLIEARNEADTVLRATEKALAQGTGLILAEEVRQIEEAVADLRAARNADDVDRLRAATDRLNQTTQHLAEVLMDSALQDALLNRKVTESPAHGTGSS
jgi:molecular chaperone DnaK (HSP70)